MELGLSLGEAPPARAFSPPWKSGEGADLRLGFAVGSAGMENERRRPAAGPPVQLSLLPFCPVPRLASSSSSPPPVGVDVNQAAPSSPSGDGEKGSDDDESGRTRKKLRLSKEQSAFLEESFREHNTLNPKQKIALAKQLNLRPRQVEVWFQNRRARTKLKQTEVDCEYLKSCCERLTEENRRLQKELQELRALKTSVPFYMQLPATTLTMCPSCERVGGRTEMTKLAAADGRTAAARSTPPP
ncbi:homeobox-leucine zipper protein HAT14-like isoform X2 [Wolffia australiana]